MRFLLLILAISFGCDVDKNKDTGGKDTSATNTDTSETDTDTDTDSDSDTDTDTDTDTGEFIDNDNDGYPEGEDCDDNDPTVYPGAEELCDGKDNNCDGYTDSDFDNDGDGIADCEDFCPIQVDISTPITGDGSFDKPFMFIQEGIDAAEALGCYEIDVAMGTYFENIDFIGLPLDVRSIAGPNETIIDGGGIASTVTFANNESSSARINGFTIRNGSAAKGAGIYVYYASPVISENIITNNTVAGDGVGGGISLTYSDATIIDNLITGNDAGYGGPEEGCDGGGIEARFGSPYIQGNEISENTAGDGGGIWLAYSDAWIGQNVIAGNSAYDVDPEEGGQGGGINIQISTADTVLTNNLIVDNSANTHGGGVSVYEYHSAYGEATVTWNVIAFNTITDTDNGAGLLVWSTCTPSVRNNIIYSNLGSGVYTTTAGLDFDYNDVIGNTNNYVGVQDYSTTGANLSVVPGFVGVSNDGDWTNDNYALRSTSSLKDVGDPSEKDSDGSRADIGAYGGPYGSW